VDDNSGLARARSRNYEQRPLSMLNGFPLAGIQLLEEWMGFLTWDQYLCPATRFNLRVLSNANGFIQ